MGAVIPVVALLDFPGRYNGYGLRAVPYDALGLRLWDVYRTALPSSVSAEQFAEQVVGRVDDRGDDPPTAVAAVVASCASMHWATRLATAWGRDAAAPPPVIAVNPGVPTEREVVAEIERVFGQLEADPADAVADWRSELTDPRGQGALRARALRLLGASSERDVDASLREFLGYQLGWIYYLTAARRSGQEASIDHGVQVLSAAPGPDETYDVSVADILGRLSSHHSWEDA